MTLAYFQHFCIWEADPQFCVSLPVQFDIHSPANSVKEALNFSAELRLEGVDAKQRRAFVGEVAPAPPHQCSLSLGIHEIIFALQKAEAIHSTLTLTLKVFRRCSGVQVLELMELAPLKSALVGVPGVSGLSVEQRKRLTIGVELVANPSIIFMVGRLEGHNFWLCTPIITGNTYACMRLALITCAQLHVTPVDQHAETIISEQPYPLLSRN